MLISLHVKDLALIDETEVYFGEGLNILSGETGAGKSIIIGSIGLALGGKADKDIIRNGAEYALVELVFEVSDEETRKLIHEMDFPMDEDGTIILQRRIMPTRSICKVCGETVSVSQLKALAELLIDIHGQHEHQSLLKKSKHLEFLDDFAMHALAEELSSLENEYHQYMILKKEYEEANRPDLRIDKDAALASFEVEEIEQANLTYGEDEVLETKYRKMVNGKKISEALGIVYQITGSEEDQAMGDQVGRALHELKYVSEYDEKIATFESTLMDVEGMLSDLHKELEEYMEDLEFDPEEFHEIEERLNVINHLKDKYGSTIEEILAYQKKQQELCEKYADYDQYLKNLKKKYDQALDIYLSRAGVVHDIRVKAGKDLAKQMVANCLDLNFLNVEFEVMVEKTESYSKSGYDEVTFMISTNPGEQVRPLQDVASGGELSRIMLALKTILADQDAIDTLIFDEIDTGISGKTAWKVSEKMALIGRNHQVICITHLPQIAAMADKHFVIMKSVVNQRTTTQIEALPEKEQIEELARMLGGEELTDAVLANARDLKRLANEKKSK